MIHLSFDQDWAPAWATIAIHDRLQRAGLRGTLFVTHDDATLSHARQSETLELGWHPNYLPGSSHGATMDAVLNQLQTWVPEARGARAHCLIRGTPQLMAYAERGLVYDASDLHDGVPGLEPFTSWTGVTRLPIWFEDDVHMQRGLPCRLDALNLGAPGLKVMTFHPVLVALDASNLECYAALKADLAARSINLTDATPEDFAPHRNVDPSTAGVGRLFEAMVTCLEAHPERSGGTLAEAAERHRA